jgi:hypothetical protein
MQKDSLMHKTASEKVWLPRSDRDRQNLYDTVEAFAKKNIGSQFL